MGYRTKKQHWLLTVAKMIVVVVTTLLGLLFCLWLAAVLAVFTTYIVAEKAGSMSEQAGSIVFGVVLVAVVGIAYVMNRYAIWGVVCAMIDWALGRQAVLFID